MRDPKRCDMLKFVTYIVVPILDQRCQVRRVVGRGNDPNIAEQESIRLDGLPIGSRAIVLEVSVDVVNGPGHCVSKKI